MKGYEIRRSYRFKARLSGPVRRRALRQLALCAELYNAALQERRDAWEMAGVTVSAKDQMAQLPDIKRIRTDLGQVGAQALQDVIQRLDRAFQGFFRRVREGQRPGFPRFKSRSRYSSITFKQSGWSLSGQHLRLYGIGRMKLHLSRPVEGRVKTVTLKRDRCGDWWVTFACDQVPARPLPDTGEGVGVDLGLASFLATSDGEAVDNPRHLREAERDLRIAQRRVARRKKGGDRRRKAVQTLARKYRAVRRARRDFHFKTALELVRRYDTIAVEDLNIRGLARTRLAKSIRDAGWGDFLDALRTKAEEAGREVIDVDARGTSQACSGCGSLPDTPKTLAVRTHRCDCGLVLDRDVNAARNILARAGPSGSDWRSRAAAEIRVSPERYGERQEIPKTKGATWKHGLPKRKRVKETKR